MIAKDGLIGIRLFFASDEFQIEPMNARRRSGVPARSACIDGYIASREGTMETKKRKQTRNKLIAFYGEDHHMGLTTEELPDELDGLLDEREELFVSELELLLFDGLLDDAELLETLLLLTLDELDTSSTLLIRNPSAPLSGVKSELATKLKMAGLKFIAPRVS